jgi:intracellular sulfur oxidation DsrE/DsrF family protein
MSALISPAAISTAARIVRSTRALRAIGALVATIAVTSSLNAQASPLPGQQMSGPLIQSTGMSFKVEDPTFVIPANHVFKALFIINAGGGDSVKVNEQVITMARYFNLHARNGIAADRVKAAAVFHGNGWPAILNDSAFAARFGGKPNPSRRLVEELLQHGATLVLCGQTAGNRGIRREELLPGVKVAISAMSATEFLQSEGYQLIPW